jgi:hypothetical protein
MRVEAPHLPPGGQFFSAVYSDTSVACWRRLDALGQSDRIEAQSTALRYFALDGTDHPSHREQASMIRCHIAWRNRHVTDPGLRKVIRRAKPIKRAKVA